MDTGQFSNQGIPQEFSYSINHPSFCLQYAEVFLLVAIRTVFAHYDRRMVIRETWGAKKNFPALHAPVVFMFGATDNKAIQRSIERENEIYKDIVQEDFLDTQDNLTLKTAMVYKWASRHCPHAVYVMVANDNIVVDVYKLIPYLQAQSLSLDTFTVCNYQPCCSVLQDIPTAHRQLLMHNPFIYHDSSNIHRSVCSGDAYLAPMGVVDKLFQASLTVPRFMPDESWVGLLAQKSGVDLKNTAEVYVGKGEKPSVFKKFLGPDYLNSPAMIAIVGNGFLGKEATIMRHLWRIIQEHHTRLQISSMYRAQFPPRSPDNSSVLFLAVSLIFVDLIVVVVIFMLIFCKGRYRRKHHYSK